MSRMALAPGRAREYETIYILRPTVDKEAVDAIAKRTLEIVKSEQGHLTEMELWGRRRLAYPIQRHHRGVYIYMKYMGRGGVVSELERQLRLADNVIRYQTILLRNNVSFEGAELPEARVDLEAELPPEADEPEISRERELGLEGGFPERDRRGRRDRDEYRGGGAETPADEAGDGAAAAPAADKKAEPSAGTVEAPAEKAAAQPEGDAEKKDGEEG